MSSPTELLIDSEEVEQAFRSCLYTSEEVKDLKPGETPKGVVVVEGVTGKFGFNPERLEQQRDKVTKWLQALPHEFRENEGGGWSFLNACNQANGVQWTGLHQRMEQLFCLAVGLGLAESMLPRQAWSSLPGGMPYYVIKVS